jgi:C-terminal processing protease CtpA/Prc
MGLSNPSLPAEVDRALEALSDTWGLVMDLRFNGGGGEDLAIRIAGRFHDRERVYSTNRYRSGPEHDQLGPLLKRTCGPRGPWRYRGPVVCLVGRKTMSSAESFALMMAQCPQVTTMGDRTAGSSANPRRREFPGGISVTVPQWIDMDPDGNPLDEEGYEPDVVVKARAGDFDDHDPVIDAALKMLRRTPKGKRRPAGKR